MPLRASGSDQGIHKTVTCERAEAVELEQVLAVVVTKKRMTVIDCDSHIMEPADLWQRHLKPKYHDRTIRYTWII